MPASPIFRQESLDRLQAGDEFDQLLVVVNRRAWVLLASLGLLIAAGFVWSIFGRIPVTVDGFGVLINPGNVKGLQSTGSGQLTAVLVREGEAVTAGDVIATLNQPELRQQLAQEQDKRIELAAYNVREATLDQERRRLELASFKQQRELISDELEKVGDLATRLKEQNATFNAKQRSTLEETRTLTARIAEALESRLTAIKTLREEGLASQELVLNTESSVSDSQARLASLDTQLKELDLRAIENEQAYLQQENRLSDLRLQLVQLDLREKQLIQELAQKQERRENELRDLDALIARVQLRLNEQSQVVSDATGRILEIAVSAGQVISAGTRVGTIEVQDPDSELKNLAYFNVRDGKRVKVGMASRVTPAIVKRERFGSIVGDVTKVSNFPITQEGVINVVGNAQIAQSLLQQGGAIEVEIDLRRNPADANRYRWTSQGPRIALTAGTTTTVRITIEERAPITYALPILRSWVLGEKDDREPTF